MSPQFLSRRNFLKAGAGAVAAAGWSADASAAAAQGKRVVILGFDGVDPRILNRMIDAGEAPHFKKLREAGMFNTLTSTIPPQSPVAWTSFTTCKNPGGHGIFDFIRRDPRTYLPAVGTGQTNHPLVDASGNVLKAAESIAYRKGQSFWSVADQNGLRCKILNVPFVYPPDKLDHGLMLCGLGVPDLRGTTSIFYAFSDAFTEIESVSGGMRYPLQFEGDTATVQIDGARDVMQKKPVYLQTPLRLTVDRAAHTGRVEMQGQAIDLKQGEWSAWAEWSFQVTPALTVHAISRFCLLEAGDRVKLYMSCLQFDPRHPYVPFSHPEKYTTELFDRYGLFKTIGWIYDTHALRQDALSEEAFMTDVRNTMEWRARLTLDELERGDFDILISAWTATDRVGHMFWRFRDPQHPLYTEEGAKKYGQALEETYRKCDEIVGRTLEKLGADDLLMVLSDHGFETFRTGFNLNTWLLRNGYLAVAGQTDPASAFTEKSWLLGFDWTKSKAYALGLSSLYLNIKGREASGTVEESEVDALLAEIKDKLLAVTDPDTGAKVFTNIYTRKDFSGEAMSEAPDISLGYAEAYQNSKGAASGKAPQHLFEPNNDKWSGEHAASDFARIPGIFFANRPLANAAQPDIRDLGVTALAYFDIPAPADFEGKSLL